MWGFVCEEQPLIWLRLVRTNIIQLNSNQYHEDQKLQYSIVSVYPYMDANYRDLMTLKLRKYFPHGKYVVLGYLILNKWIYHI